MNKLIDKVREILEDSINARDSDMTLLYRFYWEVYNETDLLKIAGRINKGEKIISTESITRARRRLQADYMNLAPTDENVRRRRRINEKKYREFYRTEYGIDFNSITI